MNYGNYGKENHLKISEKGMVIDLVGYSQGSQSTNFVIRNANIAFDAGISCPYDCDNVLLTHEHSDHSAALYFYPLHHLKTISKTVFVSKIDSDIKKEKYQRKTYPKYLCT